MITIDTTHGSMQISAAIIERIDLSQWEQAHPIAPISDAPRIPNPRIAPAVVVRDHCLDGLGAYRSANWDANGALAVSEDVVRWTQNVLDILPAFVPDPDVTPAANGSLCMEWVTGEDFFWADIEADGKLLTLLKINGVRKETSYNLHTETTIRQHLALALNRLYL